MPAAGLTWVLVEGLPVHVSGFAHLPARRRPRALCPECRRPLILKLGRVLRHHAAHAPGVFCHATRPETALHVDTKLYLAARLAAASGTDVALIVQWRCAGGSAPYAEQCPAMHEHEWLRGWDRVEVERRFDAANALRPDLLLFRGGTALAAIEVRMSHAVDESRISAFSAGQLPWAEVRASRALLEGDDAWQAARALPVERAGGGMGSDTGSLPLQDDGRWRCARHAAAHREWHRATLARVESAREEKRVLAARVVDLCRAGGIHERLIYVVEEWLRDGSVTSMVLRRGGLRIASAPLDESDAARRAASAALRTAFEADVAAQTLDQGASSDSPMRWATGDVAASLVDEALYDRVPGDPTPLATRYPRRWFWARDRREWFLSRDLRAVSWDRAPDDAFAPHPAWAAVHAVVRERPAPEDSWRTVVFASRPRAEDFLPGRIERRGKAGEVAVVWLGDAGGRALAVLSASADEAVVHHVERELVAAGAAHLWLSHPGDWARGRGGLAWAAAGRDGRQRTVVVVDGIGVYRADNFARAFARGEKRLDPEAVRERMAGRVAALSRQ